MSSWTATTPSNPGARAGRRPPGPRRQGRPGMAVTLLAGNLAVLLFSNIRPRAGSPRSMMTTGPDCPRRILPRARARPARDARLGARIRRGRDQAAAPSGMSGKRRPGPSWRKPPRSACTRSTSSPPSGSSPAGWASRSPSRSCSGATRVSGCPWSAAPWPRSPWPATAPPSRSGSGSRRCSAARLVKLGAFCASEPEAGSDVGAIRTRAEYHEASDEWILNGTKSWATNGGIADVHVVVASVDPALGARGQASFVIPPGTPGSARARSSASTGSGPRTPPRWCWTAYGSPAGAWSAARTGWTRGWPGYGPGGAAASRPR